MTNVLETGTGITGTSYQPTTATQPITTYYWNVRAVNTCGTGVTSTTRSYTTASCETVTVKIILDRYGAETTWNIKNAAQTVVASGGPYTNQSTNGVYPQPDVVLCLPVGCYDLTVNDTFGDGICCTYGNGSISVVNSSNAQLANVASFTSTATDNFCITSSAPEVLLAASAFMQGPYDAGTGLMDDDLRVGNWVPLTEPYTGLGFTHVLGGGESTTTAVLSVTGSNAIVDWVLLELRSGTNSATVIATRSALIQRDGDIVDVNGTSAVSFPVAAGNYYVALRHRNHLGCMAATLLALSSTATTMDFRTVSTFGAEAQLDIAGTKIMWTGNVMLDDAVRYTGTNNDRDPILTVIGGVVPTNTITGYLLEDVNMDGNARYTGTNNDRDLILENIGGTVPTNIRTEQLP